MWQRKGKWIRVPSDWCVDTLNVKFSQFGGVFDLDCRVVVAGQKDTLEAKFMPQGWLRRIIDPTEMGRECSHGR